ncbi:MAG: hypothetical protein KGY61_08555 [Desulfobacterales bacterium]|nr:hypothetical protein [Desulfobacterales bacterium]
MFKILLLISSVIAFIVGGLVVLIGIGVITGITGGLIVMGSGGIVTFLAACTVLTLLLPAPEKLFAEKRSPIDLVKRNGQWV